MFERNKCIFEIKIQISKGKRNAGRAANLTDTYNCLQ